MPTTASDAPSAALLFTTPDVIDDTSRSKRLMQSQIESASLYLCSTAARRKPCHANSNEGRLKTRRDGRGWLSWHAGGDA